MPKYLEWKTDKHEKEKRPSILATPTTFLFPRGVQAPKLVGFRATIVPRPFRMGHGAESTSESVDAEPAGVSSTRPTTKMCNSLIDKVPSSML
jgi:hypothetical protein